MCLFWILNLFLCTFFFRDIHFGGIGDFFKNNENQRIFLFFKSALQLAWRKKTIIFIQYRNSSWSILIRADSVPFPFSFPFTFPFHPIFLCIESISSHALKQKLFLSAIYKRCAWFGSPMILFIFTQIPGGEMVHANWPSHQPCVMFVKKIKSSNKKKNCFLLKSFN